MAAFCACCGAEITLKAGACPVCGTPQHGMAQPDLLPALDLDRNPSQEDARIGRKLSQPLSVSGSKGQVIEAFSDRNAVEGGRFRSFRESARDQRNGG